MADGRNAAQESEPASKVAHDAPGATEYGKFCEKEEPDEKDTNSSRKSGPSDVNCYLFANVLQGLFGTSLLIGTVVGVHAILVGTDKFDTVKADMDDHAVIVHVILAAIVIFTAMPWAGGLAFCQLFGGYFLGWQALVSIVSGALLGTSLAFVGARSFLRGYVQKQISTLSDGSRAKVDVILKSAELWPFFCVVTAMQTSYFLPFGLANAVLALVQPNLMLYAICNLLATAPNTIGFVGIGNFVRQIGMYAKDDDLGDNTSAFVVQTVIFVLAQFAWLVVMLLSVLYVARRVQARG